MIQNILAIIGAGLVPLVMGFIWYHPSVFGKAWMAASGISEEQTKTGNMAVIFGVSILLSLILAVAVITLTVHQAHLFSLFDGDASPEGKEALKNLLATYGDRFRTFKHGALHGTIAGIFIVLPILGTNALFERKGFKYILINVGYWTVTLALMGGIICQFLKLD